MGNQLKKNNKMSKNRNRKNISGILNVDTNINKFKSYYVESSRNKGVNSQNKSIKFKKNYELEYISKHENRFHCPKQLYSLNHKKLKKKIKIMKKKMKMQQKKKQKKIMKKKKKMKKKKIIITKKKIMKKEKKMKKKTKLKQKTIKKKKIKIKKIIKKKKKII